MSSLLLIHFVVVAAIVADAAGKRGHVFNLVTYDLRKEDVGCRKHGSRGHFFFSHF